MKSVPGSKQKLVVCFWIPSNEEGGWCGKAMFNGSVRSPFQGLRVAARPFSVAHEWYEVKERQVVVEWNLFRSTPGEWNRFRNVRFRFPFLPWGTMPRLRELITLRDQVSKAVPRWIKALPRVDVILDDSNIPGILEPARGC